MSEEPEVIPMPEPGEEVAAAVPLPEPLPDPEPEPLAGTAEEIALIDVDAPRVAIVVSVREDLAILDTCETELQRREISCEVRVMSADEEPRAVAGYIENAQLRGIRVIVAGAGPAARLPAMITVHTELPVIGVPLSSQGVRMGLDELLHDSPAPDGEPVAWVGVDDAVNAAVLAARILESARA
jgi:phosphoribosylaminoimidazole carboxylase PurE protein